jgi:hypothetical protein
VVCIKAKSPVAAVANRAVISLKALELLRQLVLPVKITTAAALGRAGQQQHAQVVVTGDTGSEY